MRRVVIFMVVVVCALLAASASARVPKFHYDRPSIVPGRSIGGVEVGMSKTQAKVAWGAPDTCTTYKGLTTCAYTFQSPLGPAYVAAFYLKKNRVVAIELDTPEDPAALAKVRKLKTAKGIHVGSPIATARAKYGIPLTGSGEANLSRADLKKGHSCTQFYAPEAPYKTITSITVGVCKSVIQLYF